MRRRDFFLCCLCLPLGSLILKTAAQGSFATPLNINFTSIFDGNVVDGRPFDITWNNLRPGSFASLNLTKYESIPGGWEPLYAMLSSFTQLGGHLTWIPQWESDQNLYKISGTERDEVTKFEKSFESEPFRILSQGASGSQATPTSSNTKKTITIPRSLIFTNTIGFVPNSITTTTKALSSETSALLKTETSISITETLTANFVDQASNTASSLPSEGIPSPTNALNRSAKIGLGIGVTIAFLLFTAILAYFFFRYGKRVAIENSRSQDPPPDIAPPALRIDVTRPPSCRIESIQPFELWSPSGDDLGRKGNAELEGWTGNGLFDTERGRRAEIDGKEKTKRDGSMSGSGNDNGVKRKSEVGSWLLSWGRWVERV